MQFLNILAGTTCFFLLLISLHLFFAKKGNRRQNILLSLLLFARFGQVLNSLFITTGRAFPLSFFYQFFTPFYFVAPACFYLYITGFVFERTRLRRKDLLHFIPAVIAVVHVIPWPGMAALNWQQISAQLQLDAYHTLQVRSGLFPSYIHSVIRPLLTIFYLGLTWFTVIRSKILTRQIINPASRNWTLFLLNVATFFQLMGLMPRLLRYVGAPIDNISFVVINCIGLLLILLYALHKPQIFYGFLLVAIDLNKPDVSLKEDEPEEAPAFDLPENITLSKTPAQPGKKINLSDEQITLYMEQIKEEMEVARLYLNPDLQILDLATRINIPVHHCSFVINNHIGKNFRDWINSYRIAHFLEQYPLLGDKITIEAIAQESGFKSQATFYNAFKKEKGVMPKVYFTVSTLRG